MKQPGVHAAELQMSPPGQDVPFARALHAEVLTPGWQLWHELVEFNVPDA